VKIEFSTARRETYPRPGAYPKVERASLKEDLIRRDFTINAMAISVNPEDYGTLIDYFGGMRDLKDRIVRVLHPVSFIEDPVRILRAIRFAGRLGFRLSRSTERLLRQAVNLGLLEESPRGRIMNEIRLALREDRLLEIKKIVDWHSLEFPSERIDYGWIFLMLILSTVKPETSLGFLADVSAPAWVRDNMGRIYRELSEKKAAGLQEEFGGVSAAEEAAPVASASSDDRRGGKGEGEALSGASEIRQSPPQGVLRGKRWAGR